MTFLFDKSDLIDAFEKLDVELNWRDAMSGQISSLSAEPRWRSRTTREGRPRTSTRFSYLRTSFERRRVAEQLDLDPEWLNDGAKGFAPGDDPAQTLVFEGEFLSVAVASPKYLLAMKLLASRTDRDVDDIRFLYKLSGLSTAEGGVELLQSYYPSHVIPTRAKFLLQELFPEERSHERDPGLGL